MALPELMVSVIAEPVPTLNTVVPCATRAKIRLQYCFEKCVNRVVDRVKRSAAGLAGLFGQSLVGTYELAER